MTYRTTAPLAHLRNQIGQEVGLSRWFALDQAKIDAFAALTEDHQFIHVDPDAAAKTPFGTTVAHGFLTLSMLSAMAYDAVPLVEGSVWGVNYGFDKVRFVAPVPTDTQIRARFVLSALEEEGRQITQRLAVSVEIEGQSKPALVADWITRVYLAE